MMIQEKIRSETLAEHSDLRAEDPESVGRPAVGADDVEALAGAFGNSTQQDRLSARAQTERPTRSEDLLP